MSRIVRSSKFRHVFGTAAKSDKCYAGVKITKSPWESNMCAVNSKFVAVVLEAQGGGTFMVIPTDKVGRLDINFPKVCGHRSNVMDVAWNPFNENIVASCSEDCMVKIWEIPDEGLKENWGGDKALIELSGHNRKCGHIHWHPTAENILASSGFDNIIIIWNVEIGKEMLRVSGHPDTIYSFDWNVDGSLIATTCKDKKIRVINPRKDEIIAEGQGHTGSKASRVIFCGSTGKIFTTGFSRTSDRQYGVWNSLDLGSALTFENIDNGMGVLFPFWDEGTKMVYIVGKGDTQIKYFEIVDSSPYAHFLTMYQSSVPQRGVGVLPKRNVNFMECEVMRFYKLQTKGIIEPIAMTVPRKSEMFQDDIYPPAYAGVPSMSADDWLGGMNKDPVTVSFTQGGLVLNKPPEAKKDAVPTKKVEAAKSKSPAIDPENMTPMQAKVHAYEKRSSSTELRSSSRGSGSVSPPAVTSTSPPVTTSVAPRQEPQSDAEYRKAYYSVMAENEDLKAQLEELKKRVASLERRSTYKRH
ncbi:coronin-1A-like [Dysidea avara]|uniref:coronin-1A-like n=1 Tax=Dysidea avara TaxID=196820 RepID=UPI0033210420